ncbi:hypothetical protein FACS189459_3940 [Bacilli bacterium]|nr:hypothetical protein FACS189459_3940 [Bacilli bacterium]
MLSNNFCYRDANVGGCAQSCRWSVDLLDSNKNLIAKNFTMSAKDMCLYKYTSKLIDAGVKSFKIEGRMKSEHYIATVVNAYRKTINAIYNNVNISDEYEIDLSKAANRETDIA